MNPADKLAEFWNQRYGKDEFAYGVEPNDFLVEFAPRLPTGGNVLCLADGEGRNGVWLAMQGHLVTSVDIAAARADEELDVARGDDPDAGGAALELALRGELGGLEYENFNAANPEIIIHGRSVHTGDAKGKMVNAISIASQWQSLLPEGEKELYVVLVTHRGDETLGAIIGSWGCT